MKRDLDAQAAIAEALYEAAVGSAMPAWQLRLFRKLLAHAAKGRPLTIPYPPRGTLPRITVLDPPRRSRAKARKVRPVQGVLL